MQEKKKLLFLAVLKFIGLFLLNRLLLLLIMCIYEYDTIRQYTFIILFGKKNHVKETWFYETKDYCISIYIFFYFPYHERQLSGVMQTATLKTFH